MKIVGTSYTLATTSADYKAARVFLAANDVPHGTLSFPTVIARREKDIIGVLSTIKSDKAIAAGPVFVKVDGNPAIVTMRLVEAYEVVLRSMGVKTYVFALYEHQTPWISSVQRSGEAEPWTKDDEGRVWFKRKIA